MLVQQTLGDVLRDAEDVRMCGVQPVRPRLGDAGEGTAERVLLAEREEALQQTALVHDLDAAHVQAERAGLPVRLVSRSSTTTCTPCSRNSLASIKPVGPPPAMITSIITPPISDRTDCSLAAIPLFSFYLSVISFGHDARLAHAWLSRFFLSTPQRARGLP